MNILVLIKNQLSNQLPKLVLHHYFQHLYLYLLLNMLYLYQRIQIV